MTPAQTPKSAGRRIPLAGVAPVLQEENNDKAAFAAG